MESPQFYSESLIHHENSVENQNSQKQAQISQDYSQENDIEHNEYKNSNEFSWLDV